MDYTQDYIQILKESLEKKLKLLEEIADYNNRQKEMFKAESLDIEEYDKLVEAKSSVVDRINELDEGFSLVYDRVGEILKNNREAYRDDIAYMQGYISKITEQVSSIQSDEKRLFEMAKEGLDKKRQEVGTARKSSQMAASYYKSMSRASMEPQFMDKKK